MDGNDTNKPKSSDRKNISLEWDLCRIPHLTAQYEQKSFSVINFACLEKMKFYPYAR